MMPTPENQPDTGPEGSTNTSFDCQAPGVPVLVRRTLRLDSHNYALALASAAQGRSQDTNLDLTPYAGSLPFPATPAAGRYTTRARDHVVDQSNVDAVFSSAAEGAKWLIQTIGIDCAPTDLAACLEPFVRERGAILFGRPLQAEEVDQYLKIALDLAPDLGAKPASEAAFEALLRAPDFLFRTEIGTATPTLTSFELAQAMAYGLTGGPADVPLWDAALANALTDETVVRQHIERLLSHPEQLAPLRNFLGEFLGFDNVENVAKDPTAFPFHDGLALAEDTQRTLQRELADQGGQDFLRHLLTYDSGFVSAKTATTFGVDGALLSEPTYMPYPTGTRSGILTDPSWLIARSEPLRNNPIRRGKFIRVELLCGAVPPIPIDLEIEALPDEPTSSMKQTLLEHRIDPSCAGCHQLMDPLGLTLERFDHVGRYRDQELGMPIDASGELSGSGDQDGPVSGPFELAQRLAASSAVSDCFSKQVYQYFAAYDPSDEDGCALASVAAAFRQKQSLVDLFAALYSPSVFAARKEPQP